MHHPRSTSDVLRLRLAAFLLVGNCLFALIASGLLAHSLVTGDRRMAMVGTGLVVAVLFLIVVQWIAAAHASCPLCRTPVLSPKSCMKHRKAQTLLGSHRLRVASAILLKNGFRCPYCNEPTGMVLRETMHRTRVRTRRCID